MSLIEIAVLAIIAASAGVFCASLKWLSLAGLFARPRRGDGSGAHNWTQRRFRTTRRKPIRGWFTRRSWRPGRNSWAISSKRRCVSALRACLKSRSQQSPTAT